MLNSGVFLRLQNWDTSNFTLGVPRVCNQNPRQFPQKNPADHHSHSLFEAMWEILLWESARSTSSTLVWGNSRGSLLRKQQQKNPTSNQVRMLFFPEAIRDFFWQNSETFQNGRHFARLVTPGRLFFLGGGVSSAEASRSNHPILGSDEFPLGISNQLVSNLHNQDELPADGGTLQFFETDFFGDMVGCDIKQTCGKKWCLSNESFQTWAPGFKDKMKMHELNLLIFTLVFFLRTRSILRFSASIFTNHTNVLLPIPSNKKVFTLSFSPWKNAPLPLKM